MVKWLKPLGAALPLLRYICAISPDPIGDPVYTAEFAVGSGSFAEVSRDCNGNVLSVKDHPYTELGGKVAVQVSAVKVGVAAGKSNTLLGHVEYSGSGYVQMMEYPTGKVQSTLEYVTPSLGFETEPVGMELGVLCAINGQNLGWPGAEDSKQSFSGSVRFGKKDRFHFTAGYCQNMPLISGGGLMDAGFSFPVSRTGSSFWLGLGGYPYDGLLFSFKGDIVLSDHIALTPRAGLKSGDAWEYGFALGLRANF